MMEIPITERPVLWKGPPSWKRQTDRQRDRETERDRQRDRETERQRDRVINTQRDRVINTLIGVINTLL